MGMKLINSIFKLGHLESSLTKAISTSRFIASSSDSVQSSDVQLSYMLYPVNNEMPDAKQIPLIFLHGLFGAKGNLHSLSKHLSSLGRRVVTYDARNHGNSGHIDETDFPSMAQDLYDLVKELAIKEPSILGHSMGGKTAMTYALQCPDGLSSLIVADVNPQKSPGIDNLIQLANAMKNADLPQKNGIIKARKKVQVQLSPVVADRDVLSFLLTNLIELKDGSIKWRINLDSFLKNLPILGDFPSLNAQPFTKPTLFVYGEQSQHYKEADQGHIRSLFPSAHFEVVAGAGHFVHSEKPVEFVKIIQEFLKPLDDNNK